MLPGRYRLCRREVRQLLQDLWAVRLSLGAVVRQEQALSATLAPIREEARAAVQQAETVSEQVAVDHHELQRRLIPLQTRLGRLLRRGQENPNQKAAALDTQGPGRG